MAVDSWRKAHVDAAEQYFGSLKVGDIATYVNTGGGRDAGLERLRQLEPAVDAVADQGVRSHQLTIPAKPAAKLGSEAA